VEFVRRLVNSATAAAEARRLADTDDLFAPATLRFCGPLRRQIMPLLQGDYLVRADR